MTEDQGVGNVDDCRTEYRVLSREEQLQLKLIKNLGNDFIRSVRETQQATDSPEKARCLSIGLTRMEEAVMWVTKGITAS